MARNSTRILIHISTLLSLLTCYEITIAQVQLIPSAEVEVIIPVAPTPVKSNGQTHLAYELHVTNFNSRDTTLKRIEVFTQENNTTPLTGYQNTALTNLIARPGAASNLADRRVIGGGMRAVVYLWLTVKSDNPVPTSLRHRLFFESTSATGKIEEEVMDGAQITVRKVSHLVIGSPLRGGNWIAGNGPSNNSKHRRALLALNGRVTISQRFAYDFMRLGEDGKAVREDPSRNENWHGYGAEVLAVADGVVLETQDGVPENTPLTPKRPIPIPSAKTVGGNYVIINMGERLFAFYAHMQPKSIRVKSGDRVKRGQILGLLGNSGNSDAPHLHFHISDGQSLSDSEGLPFVFDSFDILGETRLLEALGLESKGKSEKTQSNAPIKRQKEMPLDNAVVRFP
jgi:murein DD-endopeptidase